MSSCHVQLGSVCPNADGVSVLACSAGPGRGPWASALTDYEQRFLTAFIRGHLLLWSFPAPRPDSPPTGLTGSPTFVTIALHIVAQCTPVGLLSTVGPPVSLQIPLQEEGLITQHTFVGPFPAVDYHMLLQVSLLSEGLVAHTTRVGLLTAVCLQTPALGEGLITQLTPVGLLACVSSDGWPGQRAYRALPISGLLPSVGFHAAYM